MSTIYPIGNDQGTLIINKLSSIAQALNTIKTNGVFGERLSQETINNSIDGITIVVNNNGDMSVGSVPTSSLSGTIPTSSLSGTIPTSSLSGTIPTSSLSGTIPTSQLIGNISTSQLVGNIPTSQLTGTIPTSSLSGTISTSWLSGTISSSNLPSYVDDVIEGYMYQGDMYSNSNHTTKITGESGKIYVDLSTDTTYRWSGSSWVSISNPIEIATQSEAQIGTNNTKMMTPLRVKQVLDAFQPIIDTSLSSQSTNAVQNKIITTALDLKAPLVSPSLTGEPTAPTPSAGDNSTRIATTAFIQSELNTLKSRILALEAEIFPNQLYVDIEDDYLVLTGNAALVSNDYTEITSNDVSVTDDYLVLPGNSAPVSNNNISIENDYLVLPSNVTSISNDYAEITSNNVSVSNDYLQF